MKNETETKPWSLLIYGTPKIGLSSLASNFPDPLFLNLDDHLNHLKDVRAIDITNWEDFIRTGAEISEGKSPSQTLVVAHVERLWSMVCDHVTTVANGKNGTKAENISDLSYSEWRMAIDTFEQKLKKLTSLGNTVFLSHEIAEVRNIRGLERTHFLANLERKAQLVVLNLVDATGRLYTVEQDMRILSFIPQENQITGSRIPELTNKKFVFQDQDVSSFIRVIQSLSGAHQPTKGATNESSKSNQTDRKTAFIKGNYPSDNRVNSAVHSK